MLVPKRHDNSSAYRYGFNGKEKDDEVKGQGVQYDYGFRIYDARIGKFLSQDPLFQSYPHYTPYQFSGNNPIRFIDLDGLEEDDHGSNFDIRKFLAFFGLTTPNDRIDLESEDSEESNNYLRALDARHDKVVGIGVKLQQMKETTMEVADFVLPVELANQIITGKNIDGTEASPERIAMNVLAIIPVGKVLKGGKYVVKYGEKFYDISKHVAKYNIINTKSLLSGASTKLGTAMKKSGFLKNLGEQAHHIIPINAIADNKYVKRLVANGWNINSPINGKWLDSSRKYAKKGFHTYAPEYDKWIKKRINDYAKKNGEGLGLQKYIETELIPNVRTMLDGMYEIYKKNGENMNDQFRKLNN